MESGAGVRFRVRRSAGGVECLGQNHDVTVVSYHVRRASLRASLSGLAESDHRDQTQAASLRPGGDAAPDLRAWHSGLTSYPTHAAG
jgi:hypothetical protein